MKMNKGCFGVSVLAALFFACLLFASKMVNDNCVNETGKRKVLIAMQNGQFKDSVMVVVKAALENDSYCVKVIPLGDLGDEVMENYSASVIVNTCHCGGIGGKAKKFLKKLSPREKQRVVLFTTTGKDGGWQPKDLGVDCVTSASKLSKALSVADTITFKTREILKRQ
jgi:hypothetical protein